MAGLEEKRRAIISSYICYNDLVEAATEGEMKQLLDKDGKMIVSDTKLQSILPPQLRQATQRHKQMCGCEL